MSSTNAAGSVNCDVLVVGAGMAGLYGTKVLRDRGYGVVGLEAAPEVGGVWYHNAYPGARVDVESLFYCYFFDPVLYAEWKWTEKYATQAELLAYFKHIADRFELRRHYRFNTRVVGAEWDPGEIRWRIETESGAFYLCRYLVMATGQLSKPRAPDFPGLNDFKGEWAQTSEWHPVQIEDVRVAVVGTGSSGVQATTAIAHQASKLYVLQRTPGYVVPIPNGPLDEQQHWSLARDLNATWRTLSDSFTGVGDFKPLGTASDFAPDVQQNILEERWGKHQFGIFTAFSDMGTNLEASEVVAEFVRKQIRVRVDDKDLAEQLIQHEYPIGARRIVFAHGYYEAFNRPNVELVNLALDPVDRIIDTGILLSSGRAVDVDTIVFAIGFEAFMGAIHAAGIRNEHGRTPTDHWDDGPQTYLGLMTRGFPNLFIVQGPGSPATLSSNMNLTAVHTMNFIADLLDVAAKLGATRIEPEQWAVDEWTAHVNEVARPLLRRQDDNYMVHRTARGERVLIPYAGGVGEYNRRCAEVAANGFKGFEIT